jgi:enoyl-CoA hydratase/carnithine racemase
VTGQRVRVEVADAVADVRLARGDKHNGLDWPMFEALNAAIDEIRDTSGIRAAVLSGEGPSFCSGLDFASFLSAGDPKAAFDAGFARQDGSAANFAQRVAYGWRELPVPVIAAVHGACFGGGLQIALGADIRIAAPDTRLSVMEIRYGLIPDMGLSGTLPGLVRPDVARELTYTGRIVEAPEALELGLVTRVSEEPLAAARELAGEIAARSPDAIRSAKRLFENGWTAGPAESLALEAELQQALLGTPNQLAAVQATLSKQPASFAD